MLFGNKAPVKLEFFAIIVSALDPITFFDIVSYSIENIYARSVGKRNWVR